MWAVVYALVVLLIAAGLVCGGIVWVRSWQEGRAATDRTELEAEAAGRLSAAASIDRRAEVELVTGSAPLAEVVHRHQTDRAKVAGLVDGPLWDWGPEEVSRWLNDEIVKAAATAARRAAAYQVAVVVAGLVIGVFAALIVFQVGQTPYSN